jgi:hypothetical protein
MLCYVMLCHVMFSLGLDWLDQVKVHVVCVE